MILHDLIETFLRRFEGGLGRYLRYQYYRRRLGSCGRHVQIDTGVCFANPRCIHLGDHVWIDRNVIIIAGKNSEELSSERLLKTTADNVRRGEVHIGQYSHIGIGTIIQGHGGVRLSEYCTTSAGCKIYSYSNDVSQCRKGTLLNASYIVHPVVIGANSWLGINTTVLGHEIGKDCFVKPHTVVTENVPDNCIYGTQEQSLVIRKRFDNP